MIIYRIGGERYCKSLESAIEKGKNILRKRYEKTNEDWKVEQKKDIYFLKVTYKDCYSTLNAGCVIRPLELED